MASNQININIYILFTKPKITVTSPQWVLQKPLSVDPRLERRKTCSGRATEDGSLSQDRHTFSRCRMYRTEQQNLNLQIALTEYLIQFMSYI